MAGPYLLELHAVEAVGQVFQLRQRLQADRCVQGLLTLMLQLARVKVMAQLEQRYGLAQCQASLDASIQPVQQQAHCVCCDVQLSGVAYICKLSVCGQQPWLPLFSDPCALVNSCEAET